MLDGIEPLQYPPNSPQAGEFKDDALAALLHGLAMDNAGLCIVASRESLKNLQSFHGDTVEEKKLDKLPRDAGLALLRHVGVVGTDEELTEAWRDTTGHALALQLLGRFIAHAFPDRDIRHRKQVNFAEADRETPGRTAMKMLLAYEKWLESAGPERQRDLAVLRLTGLFDRPASPDCLAALRAAPSIPGLTDAIVSLNDRQWHLTLEDLEQLDLITLGNAHSATCESSAGDSEFTVDAHPLVREYFAEQLKKNHSEALRAGHSRLFDHLCKTTDYRPNTLADLQPLYQAVAHGCLAGRQQEACQKVYIDRILRGTGHDGFYSSKKLGAIGANLSAVAAFFDEPWTRLLPSLRAPDQAWLLAEAASTWAPSGVSPRRSSPPGWEWSSGSRQQRSDQCQQPQLAGGNPGRLDDAIADGRRAMEFADRTGDPFERTRTAAPDALHQAGQRAEAGQLFAAAQRVQAKCQPQFPLLYSLRGFRYADLLLAPVERTAWQSVLRSTGFQRAGQAHGDDGTTDVCAEVERRAKPDTRMGDTRKLAPRHRPRPPHLGARTALPRATLRDLRIRSRESPV